MTQEEHGTILGVKKAAVQKMESGKTSIGVDKLMLVCKTFRVLPVSVLYGDVPALWKNVYNVDLSSDLPRMDDRKLVAKLDALAEARFGEKGIVLLNDINALNEEGVKRAISYVGDLVKIEEYRIGEQPRQ